MGKAMRLRTEQDSKGQGVNIKTKYLELLQRFCGAEVSFMFQGLHGPLLISNQEETP